ncbi:MAG: hypothetical protein ABSE17_03570 [Candidatus Levyibacteriota bacterium]
MPILRKKGVRKMLSSKMFYKVAGVVFAIVGLLHLLRVVLGWNMVYAGWDVPAWLSLVAAVVLAYLSFNALKLSGLLK